MAVRNTQVFLEAIISPEADIRITQEYVDAVIQPTPPDIRLTQEYSDVLVRTIPDVRLTQAYLELVLGPVPPVPPPPPTIYSGTIVLFDVVMGHIVNQNSPYRGVYFDESGNMVVSDSIYEGT